jgi:hypothetical protein
MRNRPVLLTAVEDWYCPNCMITDRTRVHSASEVRMHTCPGLHLLAAPLIRAGIRCKVEAEERQEYLGTEVQQRGDDGRQYMAVRTTRDEGCDLVAFAGLATAGTPPWAK